ncbi:MAG TPA: hypothetical protein VFE63_11770 [Roseiarcus sp.]|jgi:hypothetical protein|nr:hypothetical protein [Roseiarcus sp.]
MQKRSRRETFFSTRGRGDVVHCNENEIALLAEFMRHDSVASLAGAIAARLGGKARQADLIARADLDARQGRG